MTGNRDVILQVRDLTKNYSTSAGKFGTTRKEVLAVDHVTMQVYRGETLGVVGESGCGKSTLGKIITHLLEPTSGEIYFEGEDIFAKKGAKLRELRQKMQIVFQDPYASLNPRMTIGDIIAEPLEIAGKNENKMERVIQLLEQVGMNQRDLRRFPGEFSGGQRQRVCIARAIALNPELLVCDEPVSALDVSVQSQILNLFNRLKKELGLTYIFISHDLSVVRHISDRICVMYLGNIVETGTTEAVYNYPEHPYTQCLLAAVLKPMPGSRHQQKTGDSGETVKKANVSAGCPFYPRCPKAMECCKTTKPEMTDMGEGHMVKCHLVSGKM